MQLFFTPLTILIATCAGFVVGMIWYSPFLFSKAWEKAHGLTEKEKQKHSTLYTAQTHLYSLVAHGAMASVLGLLFDLLGVTSLKAAVSLALLLALGFVVTVKFIELVYSPFAKHYEKGPQVLFLISSGYYLTLMVAMSVAMFYVVF